MKKIFLGGPGSCDVHYDKYMIYEFLDTYYTEFKLTNSYLDADLIVIIDTCIGTYNNLLNSINYIEKILKTKKKNSQIIVSGCLTKGVNFELTDKQKRILEQVIFIKNDNIVEYVCRILRPELDSYEEDDISWLEDYTFPFEWEKNSISFSIVEGCNNHCSFCKTNYMNFPVRSIPFQKIEKMVEGINEFNYPFNYMQIYSSNVTLYGTDIYSIPKTHEAIKLLTSPDCVKFVSVGCLINFYPGIIKEIIENPKIKIIYVSLESGSERIYNLMNRPISFQNLINTIKFIKQHRPDIVIKTELICGFPTETIDDLKRSIDIVQELELIPIHAYPYTDSPQIASSKLKQHKIEYNIESSEYVKDKLYPILMQHETTISNREMLVIEKNNPKQYYEVLQIDGDIKNIRYDQLENKYNVNDIIPANSIIPKQIVKRKIKQNKKHTR